MQPVVHGTIREMKDMDYQSTLSDKMVIGELFEKNIIVFPLHFIWHDSRLFLVVDCNHADFFIEIGEHKYLKKWELKYALF